MFKKLNIKNFKSFRDAELDLTGTKGMPLKYAFIYGENGSGKSNITEAFSFLKGTLHTMDAPSGDHNGNNYGRPLESLSKNARLIDSEGNMALEFNFILNGRNGRYEIAFDERGHLVLESLNYLIGERAADIFRISSTFDGTCGYGIDIQMSPELFRNRPFKEKMNGLVHQFWGNHTMMSIINDQIVRSNVRFMEENVGTGINDVLDFMDSFTVHVSSATGGRGFMGWHGLPLDAGMVEVGRESELRDHEKALNIFFTSAYSDIKKVFYETDYDDGVIRYRLVFKKAICGKLRNVDVSTESDGTRRFLSLFPALLDAVRGKTVIYDDIGKGIHDVMMREVITDALADMDGQLIATTHTTSLLEDIDPKGAFVIQIDCNGEKRILQFNRIERTGKNHNNRDRYLNGVFDGIPISGCIYLADMVKCLNVDPRGKDGTL